MRIRLRYVIPAILLTALVSVTLTYGWTRLQYQSNTADADWAKLKAVYQVLNEGYVQPVEKEKLLSGAVNGMMQALDDPYSTYMSPEEAKSFEENISASFVGIGAEIQEVEGKIVVISPIKGSPAEKAGIKPNDRILKVGDTSLEGMKANEAVKVIRGEKGSKAELTVERPGEAEELNITIIRDTIPMETVYGEMKENQIGLIQIAKFSETTATEFAKHLKELKDQGMKGLVIDLRQNPGGLLDVSFEMAEMLVPADKTVLQVEFRDGSKEVYRSKGSGSNPDVSGINVVALVDEGTASAGEILAGALQESAAVKLVGQKTFGKGTAQTVTEFKDGSNIKYTNAKWLTPSGKWIHKTGIEPDVAVKMPDYANLTYIDPEKELKRDTSTPDVKTAQEALTALGYTVERNGGYFDEKTEAAVIAFQKAQGLEATGVVSGQTTRRLMEKVQELIRANDTQLQSAIKLLTNG